MKKGICWAVMGFMLSCMFLFFPITRGVAEEVKLNLPPAAPSIEEVTQGKVKIGDLITKDNVDLVKDYLSLGVYQFVKDGMVLRMAKNLPPEKLHPRAYLEATEKNKGKAVIDDHLVVRLQDGSPWPGGIPFIDPKTGAEEMGNFRFGHSFDDFDVTNVYKYINKEGQCTKTSVQKVFMFIGHARVMTPPLGEYPGHGDEHERLINVFVSPRELKGLGQFTLKYVDDTAKPDEGFCYLPAFKRVIRVSATTYQDNVGGTDMTFGDIQGLREPYSEWTFKLIGKKLMLITEPVRENQPVRSPDGLTVDSKIEYDVGMRFPRLGWTINPVIGVDATPKDPAHIYGKKVLYICAPYYEHDVSSQMALMDVYDRTGKLWKSYIEIRGIVYKKENGVQYLSTAGMNIHDLQSGHSTQQMVGVNSFDSGMKPEFLSFKKLLEYAR